MRFATEFYTTADRYNVTVSGGAPVTLDQPLQPMGRIEGRVTDALTGEPLAHVAVWSRGSDNGYHGEVFSDKDGHYVQYLDADVYHVNLDSQLYTVVDEYNVSVASGAATTLDQPLQPMGRIEGRVTDALTGEPLAHVALWSRGSDNGYHGEVFSDKDGHYVQYLDADVYHVNLDSQLYTVVDEYNVSVASGAATTLDQPLQPMGRIEGRVTDALTGEPLAHVALWSRGSDNGYHGEVFSDKDGHYVQYLDADVYHVNLDSQLYTVVDEYNVSVASGAATTLDQPLQPMGRIEGRVTDALTGEPLAHVALWSRGSDNGYHGEVFSDKDGHYVQYLDADVYHVNLDSQLYTVVDEYNVSVASGAATTLDQPLQPQAEMTGIVTSAGSGAPLAGVFSPSLGQRGRVQGGHNDGLGRVVQPENRLRDRPRSFLSHGLSDGGQVRPRADGRRPRNARYCHAADFGCEHRRDERDHQRRPHRQGRRESRERTDRGDIERREGDPGRSERHGRSPCNHGHHDSQCRRCGSRWQSVHLRHCRSRPCGQGRPGGQPDDGGRRRHTGGWPWRRRPGNGGCSH